MFTPYIDELLIRREGPTYGSVMKACNIKQYLDNGTYSYDISSETFKKEKKRISSLPLVRGVYPIKLACIKGIEQKYLDDSHFLGNNILGKNSVFMTNQKCVFIPVYDIRNAPDMFDIELYEKTDIMHMFSIPHTHNVLPMIEVNVGEKYVNHYLTKEGFGEGFYLEKHNTPHIHIVSSKNKFEDKGYLLLATRKENTFFCAGFRIPNNIIVKIKPRVYHCDGTLKGSYIVGYTKTPFYKTYIFRNKHGCVKLL